MNYECHITVPLAQGPVAEDHGKRHHWKYSAIDGDPVLGKETFAYLTTHDSDLLRMQERMTMMSADLRAIGVEVIREKIELIVFDKRAAVCSICGTRKNLHRDFGSSGPYRCNSADCVPY